MGALKDAVKSDKSSASSSLVRIFDVSATFTNLRWSVRMMNHVLVFLVFAASLCVNAQLDSIPSCALNCFLDPLGSDGCSSLDDFACHCKKADSLLASVTPCTQGACSADDQEKTLKALEDTCSSAGVPISASSTNSAGSSNSLFATWFTSQASTTSGTSHTSEHTTFSSKATSSRNTASQTRISSQSPSSGTATDRPSSSSSSSSSPSSSSSLSAGAAAGLGVGVTLAVVLGAFGAYLLWKKRRSRAGLAPSNGDAANSAGMEVVGEGKDWNHKNEYHEAGGTGIVPENELEDRHGMSVAREREGRSELI